MSTTTYLLYGGALAAGMVLGPFIYGALASVLPRRFSTALARPQIVGALESAENWTLHEQEGRRYEFQALAEDAETHELVTADDRMFEDVGLMGHLEAGSTRVPFGVTYDGHRVISSPLVSAIGEEFGDKRLDSAVVDERLMADGGSVVEGDQPDDTAAFDERYSVNHLRENALLGRGFDGGHIVEVVNGAVEVPRAKVADVKQVENILAHAGDPEQPARAAENAENAERAREGSGSTLAQLKGPAYFVGGILAYYVIGEVLAGGGGGGSGGSGGGGDIPGPDVTSPTVTPPDLTPVVDIVAGVL